MPNIALIDLETSPLLGFAWATYDTNILKVIRPVNIICAAWKWLDGKEVTVKAQCDYPDYEPGVVNDKSLVKDVWEVLDKADVVIAHNGDSFDIKICNARFIANGLNAPSDYKSIDTLKVAKKYFRFNSNKLDDLGGYLDEGHKAPNGGPGTWLRCMDGDKKAWSDMKKYNSQDIILLERIYLRLRPFMNNHPNLSTIDPPKKATKDAHSCSSCLSFNTTKRGYSVTKLGRYQRYQCMDCGSWSSGPYEKVK